MNTGLEDSSLRSIHRGHFDYTWRGIPLIKIPFDVALYPMLVWDQKPKTIIELGSWRGGGAIWLADLLRLFGIDGYVHSVDRTPPGLTHERVTFHHGEAKAPFAPEFLAGLPHPWLVIEDSDHLPDTVRAVLDYFHPWLHVGDRVVIEDGIVEDLELGFDGGPNRAVREFLEEHTGQYEVDRRYCDFFGKNFTANPDGYLIRVA